MRHFCTPNIGLVFENKQVGLSKQFSLYICNTNDTVSGLELFITHTYSIIIAKLMATALYSIRT